MIFRFRSLERTGGRCRGARDIPLFLIFAGLFGLLFIESASAATRYVDQDNVQCTNSGSGTEEVPYCTISAAASDALPGDTVVVSGGTYLESVEVSSSGTSTAPIVFLPANGELVTITGADIGFNIAGQSWVEIKGFTVSATTSHGVYAPYISNVSLRKNRVLGALGIGIYVRDASDVLLSENEVADSASYGIYIKYSSIVTLIGNLVTRSGQPIQDFTRKGIYLNGTSDMLVSGNTAEFNTGSGIYLQNGTTRAHVINNHTHHNARGYIRAAPGIEARYSEDNLIEANVSHDNEDTGIQLYTGAHHNLVVNNLSYDNGDHGVDVLRATGNRIIGNTVYNSVASGINVEGGSTGATVANNVSVDNGIDSPRTEGNIRVELSSVSGTTLDYNMYYLAAPGKMVTWASVEYLSLSELVAATGQELHGIEAAPEWVAPSIGDFHLKAGSPAIDSADSGVSGALPFDIEFQARVDDPTTPDTGAGPRTYDDRGAYEFQIITDPTNTRPVIEDGPTASPNPLPSDQTAQLSVVASDPDDDPLTYTWTAPDGGGTISGTDAEVTYTPPAVTESQVFTISVNVADGRGGTANGSIDVTVTPSATDNNPPQIDSGPTASPNPITSDQTAELSVDASDPDDDPLTYTWTAPAGGGTISGSGSEVTYTPPALTEAQIFTLSVDVTDGRGGNAIGTVDVIVNPAAGATTIRFRPVADTWVNALEPQENNGDSSRLEVDGSPTQIAYLRFDVTGIAGPVQYAVLSLEVVNPSPEGGTIYPITNTTWDESTVTFDTRPDIDGLPINTLGPVVSGTIVDVDVTSLVSEDGTYSFAIDSDDRNGAGYRSREGSDETPLLVITFAPEAP